MRVFGTKSTTYSAPRYSSVCPRCRPNPLTSVTVMPETPISDRAARTSSSLKGLMIAVINFILWLRSKAVWVILLRFGRGHAMISTIVVVGGGQAGAQAVDTLRREGFAGRLLLICHEPVLPHQRPPFSINSLSRPLPPEPPTH